MKKILFIGDSSLLARKEVAHKNIYTTLIKNKLSQEYTIEISGKTKNNSKEVFVNLESFMLYGYTPDIVILNYGIVDVFPRPYPHKLYKLLGCLGLLSMVDKILKKTKLYYKLGDLFNFKEVNINKFKIYNENIIKKLLDEKDGRRVHKIIVVGIIKPYRGLNKSKNIDREIKLYNEVYKELATQYEEVHYIDIYNDSTEDYTIWDGYHYSGNASEYLANKIELCIKDD